MQFKFWENLLKKFYTVYHRIKILSSFLDLKQQVWVNSFQSIDSFQRYYKSFIYLVVIPDLFLFIFRSV